MLRRVIKKVCSRLTCNHLTKRIVTATAKNLSSLPFCCANFDEFPHETMIEFCVGNSFVSFLHWRDFLSAKKKVKYLSDLRFYLFSAIIKLSFRLNQRFLFIS